MNYVVDVVAVWRRVLPALCIMSTLVLTACGGGGGGGAPPDTGISPPPPVSPPPPPPPPPPPTGGNKNVEQVLEAFGIDTAASPRVDDEKRALPDEYAPLGSVRTINRFTELLPFGAGIAPFPAMGFMPIINIRAEANNRYSSELLHDEPAASSPWFADNRMPRSAVAADVDGDGIEEIVIVYQEVNEPVMLSVMEDEDEGFAVSPPVVIDVEVRDQIFLSAGDFNGDGGVDIVAGLVSYGSASTLVMLENRQATLTLSNRRVTLPHAGGAETQLAFSAGNVDYDRAFEIAVVVNENAGELTGGQGDSGSLSRGTARFYVLDDANTDFAELVSGPVDVDAGTSVARAVVADISLGDVDGDGVDEVVAGGLDVMSRGDTLNNGETDYLLKVFDDANHGFEHIASNRVASEVADLKPFDSGASHWLMYLHIVTADVDGDGATEIVSNQYVYEDLREAPGVLLRYEDDNGPVKTPIDRFINSGGRGAAGNYFFSWATSDMIAGDATSDRRENIVIFSEAQFEIQVWGDDQIDGWKEIFTRDIVLPSSNSRTVALAPDIELDNDSMALRYSDGSYRYILTEPVIIAALAGAPCSSDLGQNLDSCRTAFGQAVSESSTRTDGWNLSVGRSAGFEGSVPLVGSAEAVINTQTTLRKFTSNAYTVTKSILRETGPIEDSVIFYTIPMDVYTYTVLSHPNPDLVGENIEVRLPREPITVMTSRETYNQNVEADAFKIDERVFEHTAGDPESYPTRSVKNQLLNRFDGLESDEVDVGEGGGRTTLTITEFESTTRGRSFEFQASLDVKTTSGGFINGLSIGGGVDSAVQITRGNENIYQGTIGHMDPAFFPAEVYKVGLFAYIYDDSPDDQVFEVLNFWVE